MFPYVKSILTCTGTKEAVTQVLSFLKQDDREALDFDLIVPEMEELKETKPIAEIEWPVIGEYLADGTMNSLQILTKNRMWKRPVMLDMIYSIRKNIDKNYTFSTNEDLIKNYIASLKKDKDKGDDYLVRCKEAYLRKKKCGYADWYEWRMKNWGSEWNANCRESLDNVRIVKGPVKKSYQMAYPFLTPWTVPQPIPKALSKRFPGVTFRLQYADEDEGANTGFVEYENGRLVKGARYLRYTKEAWISSLTVWDDEEYIPYLKRYKDGSWGVDYKAYSKDWSKDMEKALAGKS